jgi:hypothetical protein
MVNMAASGPQALFPAEQRGVIKSALATTHTTRSHSAQRGRERVDRLAVDEPKPIDELFKRTRSSNPP